MAEEAELEASGEYLLINNNNSRTKFALANQDTLSHFRAVPTHGLAHGELKKALEGWHYEKVVVASVVPKSADFLRATLAGTGKPLLEIDHRAPLGIAIEFPKPESIGADRLANAAAVVAIYDAAPAVVVDFGTAVTFDIISSDRAYIGGVIAPGLDAMTDYLHDRTALLPKIDLREPRTAIGKSTVDAMLSGAVHGYRGLVRGILSEVLAELAAMDESAPPPKIIATGGYAELIAARLPELSAVDELLTLEGLRIVANHHFFPETLSK
jgi:type III pantothenate kinase